jgi:hypothetical protein
MTTSKEKLGEEMRAFVESSGWEEALKRELGELLEVRPENAFAYLLERHLVAGKLEAGHKSMLAFELGMLVHWTTRAFDPEEWGNRVMTLCVEKHRTIRIKSAGLTRVRGRQGHPHRPGQVPRGLGRAPAQGGAQRVGLPDLQPAGHPPPRGPILPPALRRAGGASIGLRGA